MARNFDFDKYKAIVDYIQSSVGGITTSIDNLIQGSIELRSNSVASIIKYSTSITEIVIGRVKTVIGEDSWKSEGSISLDIANGGSPVFGDNYVYGIDSMLPKEISTNLIDKLGETFVRRQSGVTVIQREYDPSVDTFLDGEVPSVLYFRNNYSTKEEGKAYGKLILSSDSTINRESAVNRIIAYKIAGTSKSRKMIKASTRKVLSNFIDVGEDGSITLSSSPTTLVIGKDLTLRSSPSEKSLISKSNIDSAVVRKDLSNLGVSRMDIVGTDLKNVATDNSAETVLTSLGSFVSDVVSIPKECQPGYSTSFIHPSIDGNNDSVLDRYSIRDIHGVLYGDKDDVDQESLKREYLMLYAVSPHGYTASPEDISMARGRMATTIKTVYDMVASRLLIENPGVFIDNSEYMAIQSTSSSFLKLTSSPEFSRRPQLLASVNDCATVEDVKNALHDIGVGATTSGKVRSW